MSPKGTGGASRLKPARVPLPTEKEQGKKVRKMAAPAMTAMVTRPRVKRSRKSGEIHKYSKNNFFNGCQLPRIDKKSLQNRCKKWVGQA
jgi:hypothetical protein